MNINKWVIGARPKTLPAAVVPVAVGTSIAIGEGIFSASKAIAALLVALSLQIATNFVNDYADGVRGSDDDRQGPTRLVASGLASVKDVKVAAGVSFLIAGIAGLFLVLTVGFELIPVGIFSILAGWAYTGGPKPYGYLGLGEVFVFVFFGLVATMGSYYVQVEQINWLSAICAVAVGCLSVCLMITNNLRDIDSDSVSNKMTLAVKVGDSATRYFYLLCVIIIFLCLIVIGAVHPYALFALSGLVLFAFPLYSILIKKVTGLLLVKVLSQTAVAQLVIGILLSVGLSI